MELWLSKESSVCHLKFLGAFRVLLWCSERWAAGRGTSRDLRPDQAPLPYRARIHDLRVGPTC